MSVVDLRSDTVTQPTPAMRRAMAEAEVGDDVYGEDPTVNRLQEYVAQLLGKEAALFVPSGTMANQIAIHCHTQPGDELICEAQSHILDYELGGAAALSGVSARPLAGDAGVITAAQIEAAIRPPVYYFPRTRLVVLENTHNLAGGTIWPLAEMEKIRELAARNSLRTHLDGARLWNACAASGLAPSRYAGLCDSVSVCFSKGLGAPVGSALAGTQEFIAAARRCRKRFGGGMRQAGILAAAALFALEHNRDRLAEDHAHAAQLARALADMPEVRVDLTRVQTNIVMIDISDPAHEAATLSEALKHEGVWLSPAGKRRLRAVTHLQITAADITRVIDAFRRVLQNRK
ncbi:MAG: low-specificity L-threonine aldolase [candidate division KSB1 bacterium]|nr:low-specificity L-threonine aldolase [candidate division KSB1 bacterium]MDZ7275861.1 low-specificity L-threonine aldolase [candidate division KSB1 bacterium]MDZ7287611.1 low-specificity L-threonine aldolase [candidate division KSB1 bacterium]MDZ7306485.1 low-specificity L-threonine aldolase [candidate division KSB1 bacterium]MDZ7350589.1 low-specificity L-threonine aldolase [candidate division KSB1 bacterium]